MKLFKSMLAALAVAMLVCGCSSSLDYVPEDAVLVGYANTEILFDSKIWKILENNQAFEKEIIKTVVKEMKLDEINDIAGNLSVWCTGINDKGPEGIRAVLVLDKSKAADIFENIYKSFKKENADSNYTKVKKEEVEDADDAFYVKKGDNYDVSVVLVNKKTLYIIFGDEPEALTKDSSSDIADAINKDAVLAVATAGKEWEELAEAADAEEIKDIGIAKIEVFCTKKEIKVSATVDISEVED